jgi:hypothetical protein
MTKYLVDATRAMLEHADKQKISYKQAAFELALKSILK